MKRLFIHHPLFRLLSPLFSGFMMYTLILLINNNVDQLLQEFLGQELYVCIGLSFIIQEFSRLSLLLFERLKFPRPEAMRIILQIVFSLALSVALVTLSIFIYYDRFLGFEPSSSELTIFNVLFATLTVIYISLYLSHRLLYRLNSRKMEHELSIRESLQEDFRQFKQGINPTLLFESLESLIVLIYHDRAKAGELIDNLSVVYRYILSNKKRELVPFNDELQIADQLIQLFDHLPYRKIELKANPEIQSLVVPGSLLLILEQIIRSTIITPDRSLTIKIDQNRCYITITYSFHEKITGGLKEDSLSQIQKTYSVYTNHVVFVKENGKEKIISLPKLISK